MIEPDLVRRTPFGLAMVRLPEHIRDSLLDHGIFPTQTEGELFMQLCLEQVPPDHPEAMEGGTWTPRVHPALDWDPNIRTHQESNMVATTAWMDDFVADCLNRVPQPAPPDERDMIYDTCFSLFTLVAGSPDSAFHTPLQQQQECMDRARWRVFHSRPPIMAIAEAKWRHWKPGRLKEESATTQRKLELHLRDRWADRIIGLLLPFAKDIPYLHAVNGENVHQEYLDLLGDTRFRTLRIHCLCFENIQKLGFNTIPWKESDIRSLLNTLRDQEITPHKLQGIWNTLRWFSARFGLLDPDSLERLKAKRKTIQEGLVETNIKPQRKAQLPSKEVIMLLEKVASGAGLTGPLTAKNTLDRYICAIARFQVACSARFNDLQHTSPGGYKLTDSTLELQAWQTKTVSAFRIKKNPVPLIAPLYTFTGMDWWSILPQAWDRLVAQEKFNDMDYLIPTVSSDFTGLIPRPGQADRTLRWLKDALHRQGALDASTFKHLSWHSFRVFIPDCAYQLGMPRDQRQYLGNWTTESTADIYTREKRKVVQRAWTAVADKLGKLDLSGSKSVPIDLDHKDWDTEVLELDPSPPKDSPDKTGSPPFKSRKQALAEKQAASPVSSTGSWQKVSGSPGLPEITQQGASLRVVSASRVNRSTGLMNIHLLNHDGKAVGCGWQPSASKALDLNPEDYCQEPHRYAKCTRCFKSHDFPQDWGACNQVELAGTSDSDSDALSSDLFSDDANDTASDEEKLPAGTLVK